MLRQAVNSCSRIPYYSYCRAQHPRSIPPYIETRIRKVIERSDMMLCRKKVNWLCHEQSRPFGSLSPCVRVWPPAYFRLLSGIHADLIPTCYATQYPLMSSLGNHNLDPWRGQLRGISLAILLAWSMFTLRTFAEHCTTLQTACSSSFSPFVLSAVAFSASSLSKGSNSLANAGATSRTRIQVT